MKNFVVNVSTGFRNLNKGDLVAIKKISEDNVVFTKNKGRKEFLLPKDLMSFIYLTSVNECTMETLFINPEKSYDIHNASVKNHLPNMTELGLQIFKSHVDSDLFISRITNE